VTGSWELRGEFLRDKNYKMHFEHLELEIYAEGKRVLPCDKLRNTAPIMRAMDFSSDAQHVTDTPNGVWASSASRLDRPLTSTGARSAAHSSSRPTSAYTHLRRDYCANVFIALMADTW